MFTLVLARASAYVYSSLRQVLHPGASGDVDPAEQMAWTSGESSSPAERSP